MAYNNFLKKNIHQISKGGFPIIIKKIITLIKIFFSIPIYIFSIPVLICLYLMHVCCIKTSEPFNTICYFPLIILFLPLFTIFNVFHSLCGHKLNIGVNYYNNEGSSSGPNYNSV